MAIIEDIAPAGDLRSTLMAMDEPELMAQQIVQQGAVHALETLLTHGCTEQTVQDMLASLRSNMLVIEAVARDKGFAQLFSDVDSLPAGGRVQSGGLLGERPNQETSPPWPRPRCFEVAEHFDREDVEAVAACLGDDAVQLREENDEDERATNMDRAASMLTWMLLTHPAFATTLVCQACAGDAPGGKCRMPGCVGGPIVQELPEPSLEDVNAARDLLRLGPLPGDPS